MGETSLLLLLLGAVIGALASRLVVDFPLQELHWWNTESMNLQYDPLLRDRMQHVGLSSWRSLQKRSGIGKARLRYLRAGQLERLTLAQISAIASALEWSFPNLLQQFGILQIQGQFDSDGDTEALRQECQRLQQQVVQQTETVTKSVQAEVFQQLQTLLTNYPSVQRMTRAKPDLPAKNLVSLFTPLENLTRSWHYEPIGAPWEQVAFDPQLHQPDSSDIAMGESVYVRFVGYRDGDQILCPAKVSRTLPGGGA